MKTAFLIIGLLLVGAVLAGCAAPPAGDITTASDQTDMTEQQVTEEIDNTFVEDKEVDVGDIY